MRKIEIKIFQSRRTWPSLTLIRFEPEKLLRYSLRDSNRRNISYRVRMGESSSSSGSSSGSNSDHNGNHSYHNNKTVTHSNIFILYCNYIALDTCVGFDLSMHIVTQ